MKKIYFSNTVLITLILVLTSYLSVIVSGAILLLSSSIGLDSFIFLEAILLFPVVIAYVILLRFLIKINGKTNVVAGIVLYAILDLILAVALVGNWNEFMQSAIIEYYSLINYMGNAVIPFIVIKNPIWIFSYPVITSLVYGVSYFFAKIIFKKRSKIKFDNRNFASFKKEILILLVFIISILVIGHGNLFGINETMHLIMIDEDYISRLYKVDVVETTRGLGQKFFVGIEKNTNRELYVIYVPRKILFSVYSDEGTNMSEAKLLLKDKGVEGENIRLFISRLWAKNKDIYKYLYWYVHSDEEDVYVRFTDGKILYSHSENGSETYEEY